MKPNLLKKQNPVAEQKKIELNSDLLNQTKTKTKKSTTSNKKSNNIRENTFQTSRISTHRKNSLSKNQKNESTKNTNLTNQQKIQCPAFRTSQKFYIKELEQKNTKYIQMIEKLQIQLNEKNLLLDQCEGQISFLKQKFTKLFDEYDLHQKKNQKEINNQKEQYDQRTEVMRRIQYSEDTLKLSQASSSIKEYQGSQNYEFEEPSFEFSNSRVNQQANLLENEKNSALIDQRTPLKNIQNQNLFMKAKTIKPQTVQDHLIWDESQPYQKNDPKIESKGQGPTEFMQRKKSVSAITATHRLASFYYKKQQ